MYCNTSYDAFLGDFMKIAIFGNSKRMEVLANRFLEDGSEVSVFKSASTLPDYIDSDLCVLPIPTLNKDGFINFKDGSEVTYRELLNIIDKRCKIVSCNFYCDEYNIVDINKREDFAYLNAIPTAEAAIVLSIQNKGTTIYNSKCLICGFGRIGKILASKLKSLNAFVTVSARNEKDIAYINALGLNSIKSSEIIDNLSDFDMVFQTVPNRILTEEILTKQAKRPLIVELSSACNGTDMLAAERLGYKAVDGTNLPEKFMPYTAGEILYEIINRIMEENT